MHWGCLCKQLVAPHIHQHFLKTILKQECTQSRQVVGSSGEDEEDQSRKQGEVQRWRSWIGCNHACQYPVTPFIAQPIPSVK